MTTASASQHIPEHLSEHLPEHKGAIINHKEFVKRSKRPRLAANIWTKADIDSALAQAATDSPMGPGRWAVSLEHQGCERQHSGDKCANPQAAAGICPGLNMMVQAFAPGKQTQPHRHSHIAILIVQQGHGHTIIDGKRIDWQQGDVVFIPPWLVHHHSNDADHEDAILYTLQDIAAMTAMGTWLFQGADDAEVVHRVSTKA